jgi:hypothetical protein
MASDLLELTRMLYGAEPTARESVQKSIRGGIENAALYDELEATRGLRQLLRDNPQAGFEQIAAYRPELALKYPDFQFKAQKTLTDINKNLAGTAKTQQEMQQAVMKQQAQAIVPLIDKFHMSMDSGMPEAQARQQFFADVGQIAPTLEQMGIGFGQPLNDKIHSPESLEYVAAGSGVYTNRLKADQEEAAAFGAQSGRMAAGVQPTAEQVYGRAEFVPGAGPVQIPGVMGGGMGAGQAVASLAGVPDRKLLALANTAKSPEEQAMITAELDRRATGGAGGGFLTPQQAAQLERERDVTKVRDVERVKADEAERQETKRSVDTYRMMRSPAEIENLIENSIQSPTGEMMDKIASYLGMTVPGGEESAALNTIVHQLAQSIASAPGAQSDKELQAKMDQVGNIASKEPAIKRLASLQEYLRNMRERIILKGDLTPEEMLGMVESGHLTQDDAKRMAPRIFRGAPK